MQALRSALLDINAFLPGNGNAPSGAKTLSDPAVVAADLAAIALNELRKDEMPIAIAVLFSEGGVLDFLRAVRGKKEFDKTKEELLSFLREFVPKGGAALRENVLEMKNLCLALIRGTEGAKVKQLSADLLKMLFGLDRDILDPEKLNVRSLFNSLFDDYLTTSSKYSSTVKASLLDLMGIICRRFSEEVDSQRRTRLMGILVKELGIQLNSSKGPELSLLAGVMKALDSLLFALAKEEAQPHLKNIFRAAVYVVQPMQDVSRYDLPKSGIQLLSDHMPLFGDFVMPQAKTLYSYLHANAESKNRDVARLGSAAMDSLLKQIKASLDTSLSDDHLDLFWHFMKIFAATLKDEKAETREISHAIRGLGLLAGVAKRIAPEQLRDLVGAIIRKSSSIQSDDPTAHASSILQAYGYILKEMDDVDDAFLSSIELATSVTILYYPKMYQARRYVAARAIADLLFVFFNKSPALFKSFWNRIAYQALILSCSGVVARKEGESSEQLSVEEPDPLYKENFSFWETLLTCPVNGDNQDDELETFRNAVYNEIIAVMLQLARNLELTTLENNGGETTNGENKSTDATPERTVVIGVHAAAGDLSKLVAANQQDFAIFANFVGFSQLFLPNVRTHSFRPWVFVFGEAIITLSSKLPLISGFYKLMEILYQITRKLDFFEKAVKHEYIGTLHEGLVDELNEGITNAVRRPYILFTRFNKEVAVMMDHFKDDLLASCLRMLLSVPADLVSIPLLSEPLKKAFRLGQSYPPLAVAAMDALEDWHTRMPRGLVRELLPKVLPSLADYIETGDNESGLSLLVDEKLADAGKANMTRKARQKAYKRPGARKTYISNPTDQDEFFHARDFRFRVLMFLGGLGGDSRSMIVTPIENYIAWDTEKHLRFTVPFKDMNLEFYLDDILPRIVEQAENSKDRKIKVVSCELLHSVTVFMIGKSALAIRDPSSTEAKSPFHKLYRRVFPALIRLAVDVDKVTRGVFRTLVFQLIHWLTKNQKYENPETIVMLETCLSAASSDDGPIRDFGAECAAEFLKYSIKHTAANDKTQMNAKSLLNRLFIMCRHSNGMKRLGASLTFSRLYRTFREESALVDQFTFEVLYNLLVSLRNCDRDKAATGTISLCIQAIENYSKIIEVKASIFLKQTPNRRAVDEFESADLAGLVLWLFHETSRNEMAYAQQCMDLFARFCRHITEPRQWLASKLKSNSNFLLNLYESSRLSAPDDKDFSSTKSQLWMKQMVTALDGYTSLIDGSLVHPEVTVSNSKSRFLKAICTFFDRHQSEEYNAHNNVSTPSEKFQFAKLKATVIIKIFLFLSVSLRKCKVNDVVIQDMQSAGIWGSSFCRILYQAIFDPSILGFAVDDRAVKSALSQRLADLSSVLKSKVGVTTWRQICTSIGDKILESSSLIENNASSEFVKTQSTSLNMFSGYLILEHSHTLQDIIATFQSFSIFIEESQKLLLMSLNASEPLEQKRVGDLLEFCLTEPKSQVNCLLKLLGLDRAKSQQDSLTVLTKFIPNISIFCGTHWNAFSKELVAFSHSPVILDLVLAMTEEFLINRSSLGQTILVFMEEFTKNTAFIESLVNSTVNQRRESLLLLWQRLLQIDRRVLQHAGQEFSLIFVKTYLQFLDVSLPLESIANSLQILSSVVESNIMNEQIEKAIIKIVDEVFPLSSSDLMEGSSLQKGYSSALQSFLDSYQQSGSPIIVHAIVRHVCRETNSFTPTIISSLREGASKLTSASFNELVAWLMSFIKREEYPASFRRNVVMIILSPTLYGSNVQFTREFFKCHTLEVIDLLRSEWPRKHEEIVIALNLRIAAWELMQISNSMTFCCWCSNTKCILD
ncbi:hypothetical protein BJ742DRAFT_830454 [Cladochytrium replicatum]|nr:hypothetical protein BJ742DRAFT_830454 [Cladochytrium replicatum]